MSYYRNQLEDWLKTISIDGQKVLDIGGGANPVKKRLAKFQSKEYIVMDNKSERPVEGDAGVSIVRDLNDEGVWVDVLQARGAATFDAIFCLEVFEYIYNPVVAMANIYHLLGPKGVAYISFPTLYPPHNPEAIDYLRYNLDGIEKLLSIAGGQGFSDWKIVPRVATEGKGALGQFISLEGMHARKGDPTIFNIGYLVEAHK